MSEEMRLQGLLDHYAGNDTATVVDISISGTRREISHARLAELVRERIDDLRTAGVRSGQLIGINARNSLEWLVWDLATLEVGAHLYALPDGTPPPDDVEAFLAEAGLVALVAEHDGHEPPADGPVLAPGDRLAGRRLRLDAPAQDLPNLHSLVFSSGTSGSLKGLRISRSGTEYVINRFLEAFGVSAEDRHLIFLPLSNYQQRLSVYCCLWSGADVALAPFQRVFAALQSERPTFLIAPPVFYDSTLQLHRKAGKGQSLDAFLGGRIRFMITGMAPIRTSTLDAYAAAGLSLLEAYGMTECGMIAWNTEEARRAGTVGKLIDPSAVTFTEDGELVITRPAPLSLGYFQVDPAAEPTFLPDGSILTGDFGTLDEDGFLTLRGRRKDVITLGSGRKVNPAEIEALFAGAEGVAELVVVSSGTSGRLGAVVSLAGPVTAETEAAARAAIEKVNGTIEQHRRLGSLVFVDHPLHSDPRFQTKNMKLRRAAVEEYFAELSARRENKGERA
ncbi:AMP-binding protein [Streptomyces sp. NPDC001606]